MSGMTMCENLRPPRATHVGYFCGDPTYYRKTNHFHLNQVSEEWQTLVTWDYWDYTLCRWEPVGAGFSSRHLKELK